MMTMTMMIIMLMVTGSMPASLGLSVFPCVRSILKLSPTEARCLHHALLHLPADRLLALLGTECLPPRSQSWHVEGLLVVVPHAQ